MTWFKLDDNAVDHPKVSSLSDSAFRWWVRGLSYASRFLTDGLLPPTFWRRVHKTFRKELTGARLWDWKDPDFVIHDYAKHQSMKEDVEYERERNREKAAAYRERRKKERRSVTGNVTGNVTGSASPPSNQNITGPENREQIQRTENREQQPPPPRLISGESNPRTWGRIHGEHVTGFCDWVCLPEFLFNEFCRKSGQDVADAYVRSWAVNIRAKFTGQAVGDNLKFWRERWSDSHPVNGAKREPDTAHMERLLAIERGERKR